MKSKWISVSLLLTAMLLIMVLMTIGNSIPSQTSGSILSQVTITDWTTLPDGVYQFSEPVILTNVDGSVASLSMLELINMGERNKERRTVSFETASNQVTHIVTMPLEQLKQQNVSGKQPLFSSFLEIKTDPKHPETKTITRYNPFEERE